MAESPEASPAGRISVAGLAACTHGRCFELGKAIGHFGYSVRKKPGPIVRK